MKRFTEARELSDSGWKKVDAIQAINDVLGKKRRHADTTDLMVQINAIINDYVEIEPQTEGITESRQFDISKIDFDLLRREFARSKRKNLVLKDLQEL